VLSSVINTYSYIYVMCRSQWLCSLRRRPAAAWLLGSRVRIPLRAWKLDPCVSFCVGSGLCDELITRLEESYHVYVCMCVRERARVCVCAHKSICVWSRKLNNDAVEVWFGLLCHRKRYYVVCTQTTRNISLRKWAHFTCLTSIEPCCEVISLIMKNYNEIILNHTVVCHNK
jgi:hypothetical protein